jgi:hypothetical protein
MPLVTQGRNTPKGHKYCKRAISRDQFQGLGCDSSHRGCTFPSILKRAQGRRKRRGRKVIIWVAHITTCCCVCFGRTKGSSLLTSQAIYHSIVLATYATIREGLSNFQQSRCSIGFLTGIR